MANFKFQVKPYQIYFSFAGGKEGRSEEEKAAMSWLIFVAQLFFI